MKTLRSAKFRLAAIAVILTLVTPPPARAEILLNQDGELSYIDYNPCTGEFIAVSGTTHTLLSQTFDNSGNYHLHALIGYQDVKAIGLTTGTTYVVPGQETVEFSVTDFSMPTWPANETAELRLRFISPGGNNDFYSYMTAHVTIDANGVVTAFFTDFSSGCN